MSLDNKELMERILDKLDKVDDRLNNIDKTLVKNTASLEEHMRRSDLLEKSQDELKEAVKPLLKVHTVAWGIAKIVGAIGVLVGILKFFIGSV